VFAVVGHRGAGTLLPENTLDSFLLAHELGCPCIELDVHLTSDNCLAVIHDPVLESTTDGSGPINNYTMKALKNFNAGGGRKVPVLSEVFEALNNTDMQFQIELKGAGTENFVPQLVKNFGLAERVKYTSFFHERVQKALQNNHSRGGLLMCSVPIDPVGLLDQAGADTLHLIHHNISLEIVEQLHRNRKSIFAWGKVIDEDVFRKLIEWNVDGATSDRPDLFLDYIKSKKPDR